jgi:hypothetical protein
MTMIFGQTKKTLSVIFCAAAITGCGSGGEGGSDSASATANAAATDKEINAYIEGRAVKGLVVNGLVNAYEIQLENGRWVKASTPVANTVRTGADGRYQIALTGDSVGNEFVVEVTADDNTTMRCELVNGCTDTEFASFGEYFKPSSDFVLSTVTPIISADRTTTAHVNLFTHLARAKAEASANGLGQQSFISAVENVEQMLSLEAGVSFREPIDLADASELESADQGLAGAGVVAAAFHEIAASAEWESISEVVNHAADRMAQQGTLSSTNMGALTDVALDDVFFAGQVVATEYAGSAESGSNLETVMSSLEQDLSTAQQDAMEEAAIVTPVQIVSQPVAQQIESGASATLSVGVIGTGPIFYQWYKGGAAITGANASTLFVANASSSDAGTYSVVVTNSVGSVQSSSVSLEVLVPPATPVQIVSQPVSRTIDDGSSATLSVAATGTGPISYEWFKDGVVLQNATTSTLAINDASAGDAGSYRVVVSNAAGSVQSALATISVNAIPAPIAPVQIVNQPVGVSVTTGTSATLSVDVVGSGPITYQWYKGNVALVGENSSTLSFNDAAVSDSGTYRVTVSNSAGSVQSSAVSVNVTVATHDVTLSWDIPTEREDGSALALFEIDGYVIRYGTAANSLSNELEVVGSGVTSQVISDLVQGSYYFAIATVDSDGVQGSFSSTVSVQVN